jgi:hypothetical protein
MSSFDLALSTPGPDAKGSSRPLLPFRTPTPPPPPLSPKVLLDAILSVEGTFDKFSKQVLRYLLKFVWSIF